MGEREVDADGTGGGSGRRVLIHPEGMTPNERIPSEVWDALTTIPSQTLPRKRARPLKRLTALAQALSRDGLREKARKDAYRRLFAKLEGLGVQYKREIDVARQGIMEVRGETMVVGVAGRRSIGYGSFMAAGEGESGDADFKVACRVLTADVARQYAEHIASDADEFTDGLFDAYVTIAAMAQIEAVPTALDREAGRIAEQWFSEYRVAIKGLTDERQAIYERIRGMSSRTSTVEVKRPRTRIEETRDSDGNRLPTRTGHLMSDSEGNFPVESLNTWEIEVLDKEMGRPDFQAWYRNPSRPSSDALTIAYKNDRNEWRRMCPDFLFFHGGDDVRVSIVDPHSPHFTDALSKLRGLAMFTETHGESFHRIESVSRVPKGMLRVLDLMDPTVRKKIEKAENAESLYNSDVATDY